MYIYTPMCVQIRTCMIIVWHVNPEEQHALDFKYSNPPQEGMCTYRAYTQTYRDSTFLRVQKKHIHQDFMFVHFVKIDITEKKRTWIELI